MAKTKKRLKTVKRAAPPDLERCAGCGIMAKMEKGGHPMVGIMNGEDAEALGYDTSNASDRGFVDVPVCRECWINPEHRAFNLKCHFFERQHAVPARRAAGSNSQIGG